MGGFALGNTIGWDAPANEIIKAKLLTTERDLSWVSSTMPLGAASSMVFMGLAYDVLGRKHTMSLLAIPFLIAWNMMAFTKSISVYCAGRFITGFCGGAFTVAAPIYIAEITQKEIRGRCGGCFEVFTVSGMMFTYVLGQFEDIEILTLPCSLVPLIFSCFIVLSPDTPVFLLTHGDPVRAKESLRFFRGDDYDLEPEFKEMQEYVKDEFETYFDVCKKLQTIKGFLMLLILHIIYQLSGVRPLQKFADTVFQIARLDIAVGVQYIIITAFNVLGGICSVAIIDVVGRRILLVLSLSIMGVCNLIVGVYFTVRCTSDEGRPATWLPLVCVCIYFFAFSFGVGTVSWLMMGEVLHNSVKGPLGATVVACNWLIAFVISISFNPLSDILGEAILFWSFAIFCMLGIVFVVFFVSETNQKSLLDIQLEGTT